MRIMKRGEVWYQRRRVPVRFRRVEARGEIWLSLHTDSESIARQKAPIVWQEQINAWEAKLAGEDEDAERRFAAAQELAQLRGYRYLPAGNIAQLPRDELLNRIEAVPVRNGKVDTIEAAAVLGGVPKPPITFSRALKLYWELARDRTINKSSDQVRRWENPRKKAIRNLIAVIGDKPISDLNGDDMLEFRNWWLERMQHEKLTPNSANKDLTHIGDVLKTVNRMKRLGLVLPLTDLAFKEGKKRTRPSFSDAWIRDKLLAPGALDGLDDEARTIVLVMVNTGLRPSEIAGLRPSEIQLEDVYPHIALKPLGRELKSNNADRVMPLLGISLKAMKSFPEGFPSFRESSATLSDTVNTYFKSNGLKETPLHTLYCLRHSFEDRLLAAGIDERIRRDLMGHALGRERYGAGGKLQHVTGLLAPISF